MPIDKNGLFQKEGWRTQHCLLKWDRYKSVRLLKKGSMEDKNGFTKMAEHYYKKVVVCHVMLVLDLIQGELPRLLFVESDPSGWCSPGRISFFRWITGHRSITAVQPSFSDSRLIKKLRKNRLR